MKLARERLDDGLAHAGGSLQQWVLLRILAEEPRCHHRELAERMYLSRAHAHPPPRPPGGRWAPHPHAATPGPPRRPRRRSPPTAAGGSPNWEAVADADDADMRALLTPAEADTLHHLLTKLHDRLLEAPQGEICAS